MPRARPRHAAIDRPLDEHRSLRRHFRRLISCPSRDAKGPRRRACSPTGSARSASPVPGKGSRHKSASGSRRGSGAGSRSVRPVRPCLRAMKSSTMPDCSGPGRNSATSATMSSKQSGWSFRTRSLMPRDSSWKIAVVRPDFAAACRSPRRRAAAARGRAALRPPRGDFALMSRMAQSMIVRVRSPRKSNFTRPTCSTSSLSNCVTTLVPPASQ